MGKASYSYVAALTVLFVSTTAYPRDISLSGPANVDFHIDPETGVKNVALSTNPGTVSDDEVKVLDRDVEKIIPAKPTFLGVDEPHLKLLVGSLNTPSENIPLNTDKNNQESVPTVIKVLVPSVVIVSKDKDKDLLLAPADATSESKVPGSDVKPIASLPSAELGQLGPDRRQTVIPVSAVNKIIAASMKEGTGNLGSIDVAGSKLNLDSMIQKLRIQEDLPQLTSSIDDKEFKDEIPMSPAPPTIPTSVRETSGLLGENKEKLNKLQTREEAETEEGKKESSPKDEEASPVAESIQTPVSPGSKPILILGSSTELPLETSSLPPTVSTTEISVETTSVVPIEPTPTTEGEPEPVLPMESSTVPSIGSDLTSTLEPTGTSTENAETSTLTSGPEILPPKKPAKPVNLPGPAKLPGLPLVPGLSQLKPGILEKLPSDVLENINLPNLPSQLPGGLPSKPLLTRPLPVGLQENLRPIPGGIPERPENLRPPSGPPQFQNFPGALPPSGPPPFKNFPEGLPSSFPENVPRPGNMRPPMPQQFEDRFPGSPPNVPGGIPQRPNQQFGERFPGSPPNVPEGIPQRLPLQDFPPGVENMRPQIPQNLPNFPGNGIPTNIPLGGQNIQPPNLQMLPQMPARLPQGFQSGGTGGEFPISGVPGVPRPPPPHENILSNGIPKNGPSLNPMDLIQGNVPPQPVQGSFGDYYLNPHWTPEQYIKETYSALDDLRNYRVVPVKRDAFMQPFRPSNRGNYLWRLVERDVLPIENKFYYPNTEAGQNAYKFRSYYTPSFRTPLYFQ